MSDLDLEGKQEVWIVYLRGAEWDCPLLMAVGYQEPMDAMVAMLEALTGFGSLGAGFHRWLVEMDLADRLYERRALVPDGTLSDGVYMACQPKEDQMMWYGLVAEKRSRAAESEQENGR